MLNGELYAQRLKKLIYLHYGLFHEDFLSKRWNKSSLDLFRQLERNLHETNTDKLTSLILLDSTQNCLKSLYEYAFWTC